MVHNAREIFIINSDHEHQQVKRNLMCLYCVSWTPSPLF